MLRGRGQQSVIRVRGWVKNLYMINKFLNMWRHTRVVGITQGWEGGSKTHGVKGTLIYHSPKFIPLIYTLHKISALSRLLTSLQEVQPGEDIQFLSELLQSKQLNALVQVHNKIVAKGKDDKFHPLLSNAMQVTLEVLELLGNTSSSSFQELLKLLQKPHFQVCILF